MGSPVAVGLALSLGALDGLPDDVGLTLEDGFSVGTLTTRHGIPFSEMRPSEFEGCLDAQYLNSHVLSRYNTTPCPSVIQLGQ